MFQPRSGTTTVLGYVAYCYITVYLILPHLLIYAVWYQDIWMILPRLINPRPLSCPFPIWVHLSTWTFPGSHCLSSACNLITGLLLPLLHLAASIGSMDIPLPAWTSSPLSPSPVSTMSVSYCPPPVTRFPVHRPSGVVVDPTTVPPLPDDGRCRWPL